MQACIYVKSKQELYAEIIKEKFKEKNKVTSN